MTGYVIEIEMASLDCEPPSAAVVERVLTGSLAKAKSVTVAAA
jgi:hypothetical protein